MEFSKILLFVANLISKKIVKRIKTLRSKGWSLPEIQREVNVGYGSVFRYIQGINILPKYKNSWLGKRGGSKKRKEILISEYRKKAIKDILNITNKDIKIIFACLYWAEGNKKDFSFTNTDPVMIKLFLRCCETLGISKKDLKISIRTYEDINRSKAIKYWAGIANIPEYQITNVNVIKGKKKGKLLYGMCRVRITKGGRMLKYAFALKNRLHELSS